MTLNFAYLATHIEQPNGVRYLLVGGRGPASLYGKMLRHRKLLENAQSPTSQVHALLGGVLVITDSHGREGAATGLA